VKNNNDPENVVFDAPAKDHVEFIWNDAGLLLALAIADGAIYGFETMEDLRSQKIPNHMDGLFLRIKPQIQHRHVLHCCTKSGGITDEPMSRSRIMSIFERSWENAGHLLNTATIHSIRREVGNRVDSQPLRLSYCR
jgi:hypothetical protein